MVSIVTRNLIDPKWIIPTSTRLSTIGPLKVHGRASVTIKVPRLRRSYEGEHQHLANTILTQPMSLSMLFIWNSQKMRMSSHSIFWPNWESFLETPISLWQPRTTRHTNSIHTASLSPVNRENCAPRNSQSQNSSSTKCSDWAFFAYQKPVSSPLHTLVWPPREIFKNLKGIP